MTASCDLANTKIRRYLCFHYSGLDSEIYRYRDESNWRKLQETAEQLRQRASAMGNSAHLANLLIGKLQKLVLLQLLSVRFKNIQTHLILDSKFIFRYNGLLCLSTAYK